MNKKPNVLQVRTLACSRLFKIEELDLVFSNGEKRVYERLAPLEGAKHRAVMVVPMIDDRHFLMIREYAAGTDNYELTLPKGLVEVGESIIEGANRELKEEVGYGARQWHDLKVFRLSPSYMTHTIHAVLAYDLYPERLVGDEPEPLIVEKHSLTQLDLLCHKSEIAEGRTLATLFLAKAYLESKA